MPRTMISAKCLSRFIFILAAVSGSASSVAAQTVQWHVLDSVTVASAIFRSEASSAHRVRVVLSNTGRNVTGTDMDPVSFGHWIETIRVGVALGFRRAFEFENAVALQPATKGADTTGFAITVSDSVGNTETVFANVLETSALLASLDHLAARSLTNSFRDAGTVAAAGTDMSRSCERVQDSVLTRVAPRDWPNARMQGRPTDHRIPKAPNDATPDGQIVAAVVILPDGAIDSSYYDVTGTADAMYKRRMLEFLSAIKWVPGVIAGCPVVSKASLMTSLLGIRRSP